MVNCMDTEIIGKKKKKKERKGGRERGRKQRGRETHVPSTLTQSCLSTKKLLLVKHMSYNAEKY